MIDEEHLDKMTKHMGALEQAVFRADWLSSAAHRRSLATRHAAAMVADETLLELEETGDGGFKALTAKLSAAEATEDGEIVVRAKVEPSMPGRVAARLLFARLFDSDPTLVDRLRSETPVVVIDVPDADFFDRISRCWKDVLGLGHLRWISVSEVGDRTSRDAVDAVHAIHGKPIRKSDVQEEDARAYGAVQIAVPIVAITPSAETHLSRVILDAATDRMTVPAMDADVLRSVIAIVTGESCSASIDADLACRIGIHELLLAVRFDRTAAECIDRLSRAAVKKASTAGARDLSLDELFGMDAAVAWARATASDLQAWKRGEIGWDALDAGIVLDGPPGVGKTLFAKVAAASFGLPMISGTLAGWQGSGEGHLGHLLRAMKADFAEARSKAPCVFFVDEIDSFADRGSIRHDHKDYVVAVVNGFIEQIDGIQGRQGIIFIGATNDVGRCDPAIVRAGRFNRIIGIGLPDPSEIEKMMRVRLRTDLKDESLEEVALLASGSTGADIERIVKDARRLARQENRQLSVADLRLAVTGDGAELSPEMLERASVHEAGHILISVVQDGETDFNAVVGNMSGSAGFVTGRTKDKSAGTLEDYRGMLREMLAGRAAEETLLGSAGSGSGGIAVTSDLASATRIAAALVGSIGHIGPHPLVFLADHRRATELLDQPYMRKAVQDELAIAYEQTKGLLNANVGALKEVARRLRTDGRIDGSEVARIVREFVDDGTILELST
ncbi:AAA family ATPase [Tardiphaga sp.]|jgi:cell division protease FtsH|uniref:AAA family ATPase n=1 Tax=Tardiphaga sp. TaxID=1926292 RepID=UPI0037D9FFB3